MNVTLSDTAKAIAALQPELEKANNEIHAKLRLMMEIQSEMRELIIYRDMVEQSIRCIGEVMGETR